MARPKAPVSRNVSGAAQTFTASAAIFNPVRRASASTDRNQLFQQWQQEVYRHINICGEARYSATLFSAIAGRAELGISQPHALANKAEWVDIKDAPAEIAALAELAPTVRERSRLIRTFMLHWVIAGECYLIARKRLDTDPGYQAPPEGFDSWEDFERAQISEVDPLEIYGQDLVDYIETDPNLPVWEIVSVLEIQRQGEEWKVKGPNGHLISLAADDPVIRLWNPDPANRQEAWSPYRSLLPTLREIEWLTKHIFAQVQSRLMSAGVWFLPDNVTFPPPPPDAVEGGAEAIAQMNDAEQFMLSLAASSMQQLDAEEVSFPSVVMADPAALAAVDQDKLIRFWSDIDDAAMTLRSDAVRRFALGMDLPPEQVLGSSGLAVTGAAGSAGSVNHWGVWANEEQTISAHIEPALDAFTGTLTEAFLRNAVDTEYVIAYDTATLRLRQDRSKEALEWYDRGVLKAEVALRETGFDPANDMMTDKEHRRWLLNRLAGGSASPEQIQGALAVLGVDLPVAALGPSGDEGEPAPRLPDSVDPSLKDHPYEGPPRVQHDQTEAPFAQVPYAGRGMALASCEVLVLRALEKQGNRLLNSGKRGRDKDRTTPAHMAHLVASGGGKHEQLEFDFSLLSTVFPEMAAQAQRDLTFALNGYCNGLYASGEAYSRETLADALKGLPG